MDFFNPAPPLFPPGISSAKGCRQSKRLSPWWNQHQRTKEEGSRVSPPSPDPYKSEYRGELMEPKTKDEALRKQYYTTVAEAVKLVLPVYFKNLNALEAEASYAETHEQKTKDLVMLFYKNDFAVSMGKRVFKEHFKKYWLDGFWNVAVERSRINPQALQH